MGFHLGLWVGETLLEPLTVTLECGQWKARVLQWNVGIDTTDCIREEWGHWMPWCNNRVWVLRAIGFHTGIWQYMIYDWKVNLFSGITPRFHIPLITQIHVGFTGQRLHCDTAGPSTCIPLDTCVILKCRYWEPRRCHQWCMWSRSPRCHCGLSTVGVPEDRV